MQRALKNGDLIFDIYLFCDSGSGQTLVALRHSDFYLACQPFVLRIELVEARCCEVLHRLHSPELGSDLVDGLINLANGLSHSGLWRGIFHRVQESVDTASDHTGHTRSNRISHVSPPSSCAFE